jgi:hypothetical protein
MKKPAGDFSVSLQKPKVSSDAGTQFLDVKCSGDWSEGSSRAGELSRVSRNMLPRPVSRSYDLPISS